MFGRKCVAREQQVGRDARAAMFFDTRPSCANIIVFHSHYDLLCLHARDLQSIQSL